MLSFNMAYLILYLCIAASPPQVLLVDGYGASPQAALSDAKRKAVEQGVGVVISSKAVVENFRLINDQILARADGFLKRYREIESGQKPDGTFAVKIEAEVTAILDEITKDKVAIDLLLQWLDKPRFIFLIEENNAGDSVSAVTETEIGRIMGEKGFPVYGSAQLQMIRGKIRALNPGEGNLQWAKTVAEEFPAEYIVSGKATATITDASDILGSGWKAGKAYITARIIKTDTGEIMAQNTFDAAAPEINESIAGTKSLKIAAAKLADYLIKETIRKWSLVQANTQNILLRINEITYEQLDQFKTYLQTGVEGVQSVALLGFSTSSALLSLEITGDYMFLARKVNGVKVNGATLIILEATRNNLVLKAAQQ